MTCMPRDLSISPLTLWGALCSAVIGMSPLPASALNLSQTPMYLSGNVQPNIFFVFDDSGSIDWEILTNPYWHHCSYDPNASNSFSSSDCGWIITENLYRSYSGGYRYFEYIYAHSDNRYDDDCSGGSANAVESCPAVLDKDWRVLSSDLNVVYYNPSTDYTPWQGACLLDGTLCANASFTSARSNPREGSDGYSSTRNLNGLSYHVWIDDRGFSSNRPRRGSNSNATSTPNGQVDLWDSHIDVTFDATEVRVSSITYNPNASGLNQTTTLLATLNDPTACYNALGPQNNVRDIANGSLSVTSTGSAGCRTIDEAKTNAANWFSYHRRRGLVGKHVIGEILNDYPDFRYGISVLNDDESFFVEMPGANDNIATHNASLLASLYDFQWPAAGTPLRQGLERAGRYYEGTLASHPTTPITDACQQNFTVLLTDGLWNGPAPSTVSGDVDGDGIASTVADVARHYYLRDLSPLDNKVVANPFDPATYQHMVSFTVAFGVRGSLVDTDQDGWPNPVLGESSNWGNPFSSNAAKVDDLWHAAFNSKGFYFSAQTPEDIGSQLSEALQNISQRISSSASVAQNSTTLQATSAVYQARFHSDSWKGELLAYPIDLDGEVSNTPLWNASCLLTGGTCTLPAGTHNAKSPSSRVIITRAFDGTQQGVPFDLPSSYDAFKTGGSLPTRLYDYLRSAPFDPNTTNPSEISQVAAYGQALTDYLRGVRTQEESQNGVYRFRDRASILGDIVHSDPLYVPAPLRFYPDSLESSPYSAFKASKQSRPPMIYTGANDGMLHGFNALTGEELLAYVPGHREIWRKLSDFASTNYTHQYTVDGSAQENDVFVDGAWRTILAAGLRNGAQGLYALDITDPSSFSQNNADSIYMFEFSDEDDPDVGYIHGQVTIAKVRTGAGGSSWALIFGNGYNNTQADGFASTTGRASLFVLFIEQGLDGWSAGDYVKLEVGPSDVANPNGLAAPYAIDTDGDYIVDAVYAGDLNGVMWKFDLSAQDPNSWQSYALFEASQNVAGDQPITTSPIVGPHPNGLNEGVMVYFGTGKYLESSDNDPTGATTQTFYGIWDKLDGSSVSKSQLLSQSILSEVSVNVDTDGNGSPDTTYEYRQVSDNAIQWEAPDSPSDPAQHRGWMMDLIVAGSAENRGERVIFRPLLRNDNIIFNTLLPSQSECDFGGDSWVMEVSAENGGQISVTPFDVNQDGQFTRADYILVPDMDGDGVADSVPAGGQKSTVGITPTPAIFMAADKRKEIKVLSGSTGLDTIVENPNSGPSGRQNWRQLQ